ncbi:MAG: glycoside hydrolase family 3 protein [Erysipelotrichaceae bacterium]|nr:glycoside hydrolase family 3 protein [Erysipelotrichaceae bacterium]
MLEKNDSCLLLRMDDNAEKWFCGVNEEVSSQIELNVFTSVFSLLNYEIVASQVLRNADALSNQVQEMTLREKLGQMMVVRSPENLQSTLDFVPGGYILFGNDFDGKSEEEILAMTNRLKSDGAFVMVDEEGGSVSRVSKALYENGYPSVQELFQSGGWHAIESNLKEKSRLLKRLGIDVNLNPVADICEDPDAFIYPRTFGKDAKVTSEYVAKAVEIQKHEGVLSCLKHFPGYGSNLDTHIGFSADHRTLKDYQQKDFLPFLAGIEQGAEFLMMSHIIMTAVDETMPASLSRKVHDLIRNELHYHSLIISDDLTMDAIDGLEMDPLVMALRAGNDLLLTTDPEVSLSPLLKAAEDGLISMNQIDKSVLRILKTKQDRKNLETK